MINRSWKEQCAYIWTMIKRISEYYGGDDKEWLNSYAKGIIKDNRDDLGRVVRCFEDLCDQLKYTRKVPYETSE
jgi:hypothetical protein